MVEDFSKRKKRKRIVVITLMIAALLIGLPVHIPAAEGTSGSKIPPELVVRKPWKHNPSYMVSVSSVLQGIKSRQKIVLVDVRSNEEFNKFKIPGSINIPLHFVKTKAFLKSGPLVLVNEGYDYSQLEKECGRLRNSGFTVSILNGGLNYWRQKGGVLQGDHFAQKEVNKILPRVFFQGKDFENRIVIDVSGVREPESEHLIPYAIHIPFLDEPEGWVSRLKKTIRKHKNGSLLSVLVFNEDGKQYDRIEKAMEKAGLNNVYYLKGGLKEYRKYLLHLALLRAPKDKRTKTLKRCESCWE